MARRFLYAIALLVVLAIGGSLALRFWAAELSALAFVPRTGFAAPPGRLAYAGADGWIARPGMASDPARWLPRGAAAGAPLRVAVFFVHPTSYLDRARWNAPLADPVSRTRAGLYVKAFASPFNRGEVWAPRYRQATFGAFLTDAAAGRAALDAAYADVLAAFDAFVAAVPPDTPIVLAGHSQGSAHLLRLLHDRVAGRPLAKRIAAAYLIGWPVSLAHDLPAAGLPACIGADQPGCIVAWQSFAEPADPAMLLAAYARFPGLDGQSRAGSPFLCTDPLTGRPGDAAPARANLGALVPDLTLTDAHLVAGLVPARCHDGLLLIGAPPDLGPYVLPGNNYHVYDIALFWANLRADFARRVEHFRVGRLRPTARKMRPAKPPAWPR